MFGSEEEKPDMTNKWVTNLILLVVLIGASLVAFQSLKEEPEIIKGLEVTNHKLSDFDEIELNFPSKAKVHFKIIEDQWKILSPVKGRANERYVYQLLSILASRSPEKLKSDDLEKYGLDQPQLKLTFLNNEKSLKEEFVGASKLIDIVAALSVVTLKKSLSDVLSICPVIELPELKASAAAELSLFSVS